MLLNQAIIQLALAHLGAKGYTALQTPFFMRRDAMAMCAQLSKGGAGHRHLKAATIGISNGQWSQTRSNTTFSGQARL